MPSVAITRPYEAVYIVDPDLGEEQVSTITDRYKQIVESNGGAVANVDVWERRKLAYEIKGRTEGIYVVMHFSGPAQAESELRRIFQISEDQIRAMIVRQDESTGAPPAGDTETAAPAAQPAEIVTPVAQTAEAPAAQEEAPAAQADEAPAAQIAEAPAAQAEEAPAAVAETEAPALAPEQAPAE